MREFLLRTRNFLLIILAIYIIYSIASYFIEKNRSAPPCADSKALESVYKIMTGDTNDFSEEDKEKLSNINMKLTNIVTLDKNSETGAYFCRGKLVIASKKNEEDNINLTIDYNNRVIEDDKNSFLTTITNVVNNN